MSLANTLSVLLNFKTDLSGFTKFQSFITARFQQVDELNKKLTNGSAAVNNALQAAAGYLSFGALKSATAEAIQGRTAQAQLAQALKQTNQDSAAYRTELAAAATARQRLTGIEDDAIAGVQRQLVFAKAQRGDMSELTRLTLDFAAAKEIDAVSAAKAIGRALQGEGDELARYGVEVDMTGDKVASLIKGLMKYSGQAEQAFAALPEGVRNLSVAGKEAQQSAGEVVLAISNPFLSGLADGLDKINARLNDVSENGSVVASVIKGVSGGLGSFVGANLDRIALFVGGLLALKAGGFAVNEVVKVLAVTFQAFTGQSLVAMITGIWSLRKEVGLLKAISAGGWAGFLAAGIATVAVALGALAIGSVVIKGVESAQLARLEREQQIRDVIWDQLKGLQAQVAAAKTTKEVAAAQIKTQAEYLEKKKRLEELEAKQAAGRKARTDALAASDGRRAIGVSYGALPNNEAAELDTLKRSIAMYGAVSASAQKKVGDDTPPETPAKIAADEAARAAAAELEEKRRLYALDTERQAAEASGNQRRADEIDRYLRSLAAEGDLGIEAIDIIAKRLDVEDAARLKKRAEDAKEKADAAAKEAAEKKKTADETALRQRQQAWQDAERAHAIEIARLDQRLAVISADRFLTEDEKARRSVELLREKNAAIARSIQLLTAQNAVETDPEAKRDNNLRIDSLGQDQAQTSGQIEATRPLSFVESMQAALVTLEDRLGTFAARASQAFVSLGENIRTSLGSALADAAIYGGTFAERASGFAQAVGTAFVQSMAQMVADFLYQHTVMAGIRATFNALGIAQKAATTTTEVGIHAAGEAAKTGASSSGWLVRKAIAAGETVWQGVQWVLRNVLHIGGEAKNTAVTVAGSAVRKTATTSETMPWLIQAGIKAMSAVASIPYVGPILAVAALAAVIGAGAKLLSGGFAEGGLVEGPGSGTSDSITARLSNGEFVNRAASVQKFGSAFFEDLNNGVLNLGALPDNITAGLAAPAYGSYAAGAGGGGGGGGAMDMASLVDALAKKIKITNVVVPDQRAAQRIERRSAAADDIVSIVRSRKAEIFKQGAL